MGWEGSSSDGKGKGLEALVSGSRAEEPGVSFYPYLLTLGRWGRGLAQVQLAAGKDCSCGHAIRGFPIGRQRIRTLEAHDHSLPCGPLLAEDTDRVPCLGRRNRLRGAGRSVVNQQGGSGVEGAVVHFSSSTCTHAPSEEGFPLLKHREGAG